MLYWEERSRRSRWAGICVLLCMRGVCSAQWTATILTPPVNVEAEILAGCGSTQGGYIADGGSKAYIWHGTSASLVDLSAGLASCVYCCDGGMQGGYRDIHGGLWAGTPESWIDLHPIGYATSRIYGMRSGKMVGYATDATQRVHAGMWSNATAGSWIPLEPPGVLASRAYAIDAGIQGGVVYFSSQEFHASIWTGSANSWIDLHPSGYQASAVQAIEGSQQVGFTLQNSTYYAALWYGTQASWLNLDPPGAQGSEIKGVLDRMQVGGARFGGLSHAILWYSSPLSYVDLSVFLPSNYSVISQATSIWKNGKYLYVGGFCYNSTTGKLVPVIWKRLYFRKAGP